VDTVLDDFDFKEREQYLSVYPQGYYNVDKQGRPVTIQHLGQVNPKRINQITTEDRMVRYHIQEYERFLKKIAPVCSRVAGRHIDQTMAILDVKGVPRCTIPFLLSFYHTCCWAHTILSARHPSPARALLPCAYRYRTPGLVPKNRRTRASCHQVTMVSSHGPPSMDRFDMPPA
jgi:hypothetical protein